MPQFYCVTMDRIIRISRFDRGKKVGETEEIVRETYHNLPFQTAQNYKTKFPDANVIITAQAIELQSRSPVTFGNEKPRRASPAFRHGDEASKSKSQPKPRRADTFSGVVNKMVEASA